MSSQKFNDLTAYLEGWEGFSEKPYYATEDERTRGILTIGIGFTYPDQRRAIQLGTPEDACPSSMTQDEAYIKLYVQLSQLKQRLGLPPSYSDEIRMVNDSLLSLAYNMGPNAFPKLLGLLHEGDNAGALEEFYNCIYQTRNPLLGLIYRRACDAQIFEKGIYEKRDYITPDEKALFLKMNANNQEAIDMINNRVVMK